MPDNNDLVSQFMQQYQQYMADPNSIPVDTSTQNNGLFNFLNTPGYGLMYGQENAAEQAAAAQAGTYDPTKAFREDPGFQFNQEQTAKQMQQYAASKGLLESGPLQIELQKQLQGNQNQQYQTWLGQQNSLFNNYQNQLAALTQFGAGQTGAQQGVDSSNMLAQLIAGAYNTAGSNTANVNLATGQDIASMLQAQGVYSGNAYMNTAAANANNIMQGNLFGTQLNAANLALRNGQANSMFQGSGMQQGYF